MSEFVITPNFDRKTARFHGIVAAGEHAFVRIVGAGSLTTETLRLRVVFLKKTLAVFPLVTTGETPDEWEVDGDDLTCTINLNTAQMQKEMRRMFEKEVLFVLDDPTSRVLYFANLCVVRGWPLVEGTDVPVDLDGYEDFVASTKSRLDAVESSAQTNAAAISAETSARQAADAAHTSQISDVSDVVSTKADASDLETLATKADVAADKAALASAIANKQDAGDYLTEHQSLSGLVTTTQMNAALAEKVGNDELANLATKEELATETDARESADAEHDSQDAQHDAGIAENAEGVQHAENHITNHALDNTRHITSSEREAWNNKADKTTTYTKAQVDAIVQALKNGRFSVVSTLPAVESAEENVIYLLSRGDAAESGNVYDEYIVADGAWEKIGSTQIDLSNYVKKEAGKGLVAVDAALMTPGAAADAKAVGDALRSGFTEWACDSISEGFEFGKCERRGGDSGLGWYVTVVLSSGEEAVYFLDAGADAVSLSQEESPYDPGFSLSRRLVTPTKTSQLANDGAPDGGGTPYATTAQVAAKQDALSAAQLANIAAVPNKASTSDLPYALVTPGEWEFSGLDDDEVVSSMTFANGVWTLYLTSGGESDSIETAGTENDLVVVFSSRNITATRASLPGHLCDRAGNLVVVTDSTTLTLPAANPGYLRDFLVRLEISGSTVPTITFSPDGNESVTYETDGDEFPVPDEAGTWLYSFTENCVAHKFAVSLKKVNEVAQGGS